MSALSGIAYSAMSALNAYTCAIDVTNTNISNAETVEYSRQKAVLQTAADGTLTSGVKVSDIKRICDDYMTAKLWSAEANAGKAEAENEILSDIEHIFTSTDDCGLDSSLSSFWAGWQDLVNDPSSSTARSVLASSAKDLAETLNDMSSELGQVHTNLVKEINATVASANEYIQQIALLNQQISQAKSTDQNLNYYQDQLDSLVGQLSTLLDVKAYENASGQVCLQTSDGRSLVNGTATWALGVSFDSSTNMCDITVEDSGGGTAVVTGAISSGKLAGYLTVANETIPEYQDRLDELALSLIQEVNTLHSSGYDLEGDSGIDFFTGTAAGDIAVTEDIIDHPAKIAASSTIGGGSGDSSNASAIAALENALVLNDAPSTYSDFYASIVSQVGNAVQSAQSDYDLQSDLVQARQNLRDSVYGVSIDEELTKLALYQTAYEAAAKVMSAVDEMMKAVLEM